MMKARPMGIPASTPTLLDFLGDGDAVEEDSLTRVKVGPERIVRLLPSETRKTAIWVLLVLLSHSAFMSIRT